MVLILAVCGVIGTSQLHLDTAFRPSVVQIESIAESLQTHDNEFSERSDAFIGVIIRNDEPLTPHPQLLRRTSLAVDSVEGVSSVQVVSDSAMVDWMYGTPVGKHIRGNFQQSGDPPVIAETSTSTASNRAGKKTTNPIESLGNTNAGAGTLLLVFLDDRPTHSVRSHGGTIASVTEVLDRWLDGKYQLHMNALQSISAGASSMSAVESTRLWVNLIQAAGPGLFVIIAFLWIGYRKFSVALVATSGILLAIPIAMGVINALSMEMTLAISIIPLIILLVGTIQAVSTVNSFIHWCGKDQSQEGSVRRSLVEAGPPCVLASSGIITVFFAVALLGSGVLTSFGIMAAIGVGVVSIVNLITVPVLLMIVPSHWLTETSSLQRPFQAFSTAGNHG